MVWVYVYFVKDSNYLHEVDVIAPREVQGKDDQPLSMEIPQSRDTVKGNTERVERSEP